MYEFLKVLFGKTEDGADEALTFDQLVAKLSANKDLKLANLADGGYVSKDKYDAKETELSGVKDQLSAANSTIQSYKDMDIDGIKQSAADWEQKYKDDTDALNAKLVAQERAFNEEMFLGKYQFTSKAAREGIRSEFVKRNFPFEDGSFIGGKEFMDKLMADNDYKAAFVVETPPAPAPEPQPRPRFSDDNPQPAPTPKKKYSLSELMRMKNENPNAAISFD